MSLTFKLPALILMGLVVFALAEALYFLAKDHGDVDKIRVARALSIRVTLALILFVMLVLAGFFGLIHPAGPAP
jgi:uncharacterized membrane protein SpoIIM required for sporulation